jgi:hypothetical protein
VSRSILLLACVLVAANAGAQALQNSTETASTAQTQATFRSTIDIVALNVVVTDADQKYVSG